MRLSAIKLAGFKSFVDPTVLRLTSNLTGVVGPNGCGKSNIIDAVRWVLGESSARQLRGAALDDVIFNGAKGRKPVGRALIELVFDNSDGTLGGQYARYNEISVKREIVRDGGSQYYLNGARCRRRDVVDLFLGTGLGSRSSYAIIEQGTVSRIIEARPEEMRLLIEEVAGISKYKEKRRETENRMRHTRENLDRISDLRSELQQQLERLHQQAKNAEKYKEYKKEERLLKVQLLALRHRDLHRESAEQRLALQHAEQRAQEARDRVHAIELEVERQREEQHTAAGAFQEQQAAFYAAEAEVARVDQSLTHAREMKEVRERDLASVQDERTRLSERLREETAHRDTLKESLAALTVELEEAERGDDECRKALDEAEETVAQAEASWERFSAEAEAPLRQAEAERARAESLGQHRNGIMARIERLRREHETLDVAAALQALDGLDRELQDLEQARSTAEAEVQRLTARTQKTRQSRAALERDLHDARDKLQQTRGRIASLESLQAAALRADSETVSEWLAARGWERLDTLVQRLEVEAGWEMAVEAALGVFLRARCLDADLHDAVDGADWPRGELALMDTRASRPDPSRSPAHRPPRLAEKLQDASVWPTPLARTYVVESSEQALTWALELEADERVVSRDGLVAGHGWLYRPQQDEDSAAGVLERERSLRQEQAQEEALQQGLHTLEERLRALEEEAQSDQAAFKVADSELEQARQAYGERLAARRAQAVRVEQAHEREQELKREIDELDAQLEEAGEQWAAVQSRLEALDVEAQRLTEERHRLQDTLRARRSQYRAARQAFDEQRDRLQQLRLDRASRESGLEGARQACTEFERRAAALERRAQELQCLAEEAKGPIETLRTQQAEAATRRDQARETLRETRERQTATDHAVREVTERLKHAEDALEQAREQTQQLRVDEQSQSVRLETLAEQVREAGFDMETVVNGLPESATAAQWEERIERVERRVQRLGAINLAAIQEYQEQSERAQYLEEQDSDLRTALETLESAIRKIDRETRSRFRDTFERVDGGFRELFPRLFGGGEAYLELTGEDLLETGIRVMARPPGKRNSSIQLLSGGEKALTAAALVFSLFELNPAPFCMLDEVDAPLDDANVGRFCELVRTMSERVQFILITHNKVTMELADQLHGVTMQEPGVSRLVSVDVQKALELADA